MPLMLLIITLIAPAAITLPRRCRLYALQRHTIYTPFSSHTPPRHYDAMPPPMSQRDAMPDKMPDITPPMPAFHFRFTAQRLMPPLLRFSPHSR